MDTRTQAAIDAQKEHELLHNSRVFSHPTLGTVRLRRPTSDEDRQIGEVRRKQYQRDLRDEEILSRAEIEKIAIRRGMWAPETTERIEDLTRKVGEAIGILDVIGFESLEELLRAYRENVANLYQHAGAEDEVADAVRRFTDLEGKVAAKDRAKIARAATTTEVDDLLDAVTAQRTQIELLHELGKVKRELRDLTERQTRLFLDSIESRTDRAEELARIYYCARHAETGEPLWPTYEEIWHVAPETLEVVITEMHDFLYGVSEEFKKTLGKYGFRKRLTSTPDSSGDSPVQPPSNSDGESAVSEPISSSEATESSPAPSTSPSSTDSSTG
jgi:hypothetical protein